MSLFSFLWEAMVFSFILVPFFPLRFSFLCLVFRPLFISEALFFDRASVCHGSEGAFKSPTPRHGKERERKRREKASERASERESQERRQRRRWRALSRPRKRKNFDSQNKLANSSPWTSPAAAAPSSSTSTPRARSAQKHRQEEEGSPRPPAPPRPSAPTNGDYIKETDTGRFFKRVAGAWVLQTYPRLTY